jgi:poly-beta-1,6-N-acetyl-D-glucosamine N-deacetylase
MRTIRNIFCWMLAEIINLMGNVRRARKASFQENTILPVYFHNPNKKMFRKIVSWFIKHGYVFISCDQLIDILNKKIHCPKGAVWISLDDGWKENIENVVPLAQELNIPVTIFIYTSAIETGEFWWEKLNRHANTLPEKYRDLKKVMQLPEENRQQILTMIDTKIPNLHQRDAMTLEDIRYISAMPQITLGSHTDTHPLFRNCTDGQIDYELRESKRKLESWTKKAVKAFAFPGGSFSESAKPILLKNGYELAVTIINRLARIDDNCYFFPRTDVMDDGSFTENLCHALGVWEPITKNLKKIALTLKRNN